MTYIHHLEAITRLGALESAELDSVLMEIGKKLTSCMEVERINIWLFQQKNSCIYCIGNYNAASKTFSKGDVLFEKDIPEYFSHLQKDQSIVIDDVMTSPVTRELRDNYCKPQRISSMLDIPIRIEGKLTGVLCYEHTGEKRSWTLDEQQFALAVNQVVAMAIESQHRRDLQLKLEQAVHEKGVLLAEMHHRIKNNLAILVSLLRIHSHDVLNKPCGEILKEFESKVMSISRLHEQLYSSGNYLKVELRDYIQTLMREFETSSSSPAKPIAFNVKMDSCEQDTGRALVIGLVVNEIVSNSVKYAFDNNGQPAQVTLLLKKKGKNVRFEVSDNGKGFNPEAMHKKHSLGISLIHDLCEQLDAGLQIKSDSKGTSYLIEFQA